MKKILAFLIAVLSLACLLMISCSPQKNNTEDKLPDENTLIYKGEALYSIVRPDPCSSELMSAVSSLCNNINSTFKVTMNISSDWSRDGKYDSTTQEILIGNTKYTETADAIATLGDNTFSITRQGNKIVIVGAQENDLLNAITYFSNNLLSYDKENGTVTYAGNDFLYNKEEAIKNLKVNGVPFSQYNILYKENDKESLGYAKDIQKDIKDTLNYELPTNKTESGSKNNIIFSFSNHPSYTPADYMHYDIKLVGSDIVVSTGGYFSLEYLIKDFTKTLFQNGIFDINEGFQVSGTYLNAPKYDEPKNSDVRMISANILAEYESWNSTIDPKYRTEIFAGNMAFYDADIIGVQECSPHWITFINEEYNSSYKMLHKPDMGIFTYILYNTETLEVLEHGYHSFTNNPNPRARGIAYGVFKDKETGKTFAFGSTHWNTGDDAIARSHADEAAQILNSLKKKYNCSIYCVGDFNSSEQTNVYKSFMQMTEMEDTMYTTLNRTNKLASWHELGKEDFSFYSCDHIFASKGVKCVKFRTLAENYQIYASDHSWLCADIVLP